MKRSDTLIACAASLVFATVAVLPALVSLKTSPGFPVQVFTVDDGLYLQRAIGAWQGFDPYEWTYFETARTSPLVEVALHRPNAVVDIAAGAVAAFFGLSAPELAVVLDWTCGAASLALFFAIFRFWTGTWAAVAASVLAVGFPAALIPDPLLLLPNDALAELVNQPFIDHASPAFRAVYTQVSYPFFLLAVLWMLRRYLGEARSKHAMLVIGVLSGLVGFGYFFPWLVLLAVGLGMPALEALLSGRRSFKVVVAEMAKFLAGWILGSAGVFFIMARNDTAGIVGTELLGHYWFFPIERLLLAGLLLVVAFAIRRSNARLARLLAFLGFLLALELPFMNLQPVLRQGLAPYHFPGFYLHPFVTGGFFVLFVRVLRTALSFRLAAQLVCALPILAFTFDSALGVRNAMASLPLAEDLDWLVDRLRTTPPDSVFAFNPIREPFSGKPAESAVLLNWPNLLTTLTGRYTLHQEWMFNELADSSDLRRELGMAWLLSGRMQPLWTLSQPVRLPGDVFTLTWTYLELRREQKLEIHGALLRDYTPCLFLADFRVDVLVHDTTNDGPLVLPEQRYLTLDATSPHATFGVYRFDRARALAELCQAPGT